MDSNHRDMSHRQRRRLPGRQSRRAATAGRSADELDYLTLEYLAELTLSILARVREKNPAAGYAGDFIDVLTSLRPALVRSSRG